MQSDAPPTKPPAKVKRTLNEILKRTLIDSKLALKFQEQKKQLALKKKQQAKLSQAQAQTQAQPQKEQQQTVHDKAVQLMHIQMNDLATELSR